MSSLKSVPEYQRGFTLVELLTVMAIIAILAGLILGISSLAQKKAAYARAQNEIQAITAALESYKVDNAVYPSKSPETELNLNPKNNGNAAPTNTAYTAAALFLYKELTGDQNTDGTPDAGTKPYMPDFKRDMMGRPNMSQPPSASNRVTYIADPYGNCYGYSTAYAKTQDPTKGYNPTFDLWCTAGKTTNPAPGTPTDVTLQWIKNW